MNLSTLRKCILFDHINGIAMNLNPPEHDVLISINSNKLKCYPSIKIDNKRFLTHRLAWMDYYSINDYYLLPKCIDHVNRNKFDYRIENLKEVSIGENNKNRDLKNDVIKYGKCVYYNDQLQKYTVKMAFDGGIQYRETFDDLVSAQKFVQNKFDLHAPWLKK